MANPPRPTLADALRAYRKRRGLTQQAAADAWRIPLKSVQNWEGKDGGGKSSMSQVLIDCLSRL